MNSATNQIETTDDNDVLSAPIAGLQLSVRASNCLRYLGLETVGQLIERTEVELLAVPSLGSGTLAEIIRTLDQIGLRLGVSKEQRRAQEPAYAISSPASRPDAATVPEDEEWEPPRDPAVAIRDLLKEFRPREYAIIRNRIVEPISTLEELGDQFSVTRERIRQIERNLRKRLQGLQQNVRSQWMRDLAHSVRHNLGSAVPLEAVTLFFEVLCSSVEDLEDRSLVRGFVLWVSGPYQVQDEWMVTSLDLHALTLDALIAGQDSRGWLSLDRITDILGRTNIRTEYHLPWMRRVGFFEHGEGWLLQLPNIPDRVEQLLKYRGEPLTAEDLVPYVGCDSVRSLRNRLMEDDRFKRTTKQGHFALREWAQYDEYSGIAEEIAEEIARKGGVADAQYLIDELSKRYGVKPDSVHHYLSAPMFMKLSRGQVRLRAPDEWPTVRADPRFCPALYRVDDRWVLRVKITSETLRGSGRPLHPSVAVLVDCQPGGRRTFKSPRDEITVSWPSGSAAGPNLGSIRPDVEALSGEVDDYAFLTLEGDVIAVRLLKSMDLVNMPGESQLALLVGLSLSIPEGERIAAIASAIGMHPEARMEREELHSCLMRRNEVMLARLLDMPELQDPEDIFAHLESTLWR